MNALDEHGLIARHFRPLADHPAAFALFDDAAALTPPPGSDLVFTKDGIAEGVHFLPGETGDMIARKALRVNVSDLAAMGADALGYLVLLALPQGWTEQWIADFAAGLAEDQRRFAISLLGGDTIRAAGLTVSVTAIGVVPTGEAVRRSGARRGDLVYVSGTIGDGALGLLAARGHGLPDGLVADDRQTLLSRYRLPEPRPALSPALRAHASAALDVSDGLAGDLDKMCRASGVSARIACADIPLSGAARRAVECDSSLFETCITGGDDYEILCAVPPAAAAAFERAAARADVSVTRIGEIGEGEGPARFIEAGGAARTFLRRSFSHTG